MRNVSKSLIVGVLLIEVAFGAFLLLQERDHAAADTEVPRDNSVEMAATSFQATPQLDDAHATAGTVVGAAPLPGPPATDPNQVVSGTVVTQSGSPAKEVVQAPPKADTRPREPVAQHAYVAPRPVPVPRTETRRDNLNRDGSNPVASAMTDALVKQSAQLDPALPPPRPQSQPQPQPQPQPQFSRNDPYRPGSNPVAAAMTEQLVRQSAKLDPALPPPNQPNMK